MTAFGAALRLSCAPAGISPGRDLQVEMGTAPH